MSDGSVTIDTKLDDGGVKKGLGTLQTTLGKIGSGITTAFKASLGAITAVGGAFAGLVTASVNARGELEQQIGGIKTLFANEMGDASETVIKNANNAYKTAGMSAVEYMSTATSFSASLLQSLGKDTQKAAEVTDMAITDMSDNANKMGTSMESIQWAYQGFAKQNYTMLDNLKLGYGGTKQEMERLLADAQKLTGVKYDISNLSDVYTAIHVIQGELGITGTTAKEASETLQGSMASMKAAWDNFLSGSGNLGQVADTLTDVVKNVVRIVNEAIPQIMQSINDALPELMTLGGEILGQLINGIITYLPNLMECAGQVLNSLIQGLITALPQIIPVAMQVIQQLILGITTYLPQLVPIALQILQALITTIFENLPLIINAGIQLIVQLIQGIVQMIPQLIPQAINCIVTVINTLLDNIDLIIDAGIQLILALAEGLINAIPQLVEQIPIIIDRVIKAIMNNLPKILSMGIQLLIELGTGLIMAIPQLVAMIPQIVSSIINAFFETDWGAVGLQLLQGLLNGFSNAGNIIWNAIKSVGNSMINGIKSFFGIHSPSKLFADLGQYLPQGFAVGINKDSQEAVKSVEKMNNSILDSFNFSGMYSKMKNAVALQTSRIATSLSTTANVSRSLNANITVEGSDIYMDSTKVGRAVTPTITKTLKGAGAY